MADLRGVIAAAVRRPGFRAWAARFPLTRPIARRQTARLFDLCAGFAYSQILSACLELDLFARLGDRALTAGELAPLVGLPEPAAARLLDAAVALALLRRRPGGRYGLATLGAALVGNAGVAAMVAHHRLLYADLADPVGLLRAGRGTLARYWTYAGDAAPAATAAPYSALMAASQPMVAAEIIAAYDLSRHHHLLDVGGGSGGFAIAAARAAPHLRITVFDLPEVAALAAGTLADAGLAARAHTVGGSFLDDRLPAGADLITLVRIVHDHDDAAVRTLLRAVRGALVPGGRLLLAEPMAQTVGAERMGDAYFGFYLLAMGQGRPRSAAQHATLLREAGFARVRHLPTPTPLLASVLLAG